MINYVKHPWGPHTIETQIDQEFADILLEKVTRVELKIYIILNLWLAR